MGEPQKYNEDEEVIKNNLKKFSKAQQVNSDEALLHKSDTSSLSKHNKQYTTLLKAYVKYFEINSKNKSKDKEDLFNIAKALLIWIPLCTAIYIFTTLALLAFGIINIVETLPGIIAALVSLIGTFMVVPQMITEYLFNKEEEQHLTNIISKIQEYDRDIRGGI